MSDDPKRRSDGERLRARHALERYRATLASVDIALEMSERDIPPGVEVSQSLVHGANEVAIRFAMLDAYMRAESDARK